MQNSAKAFIKTRKRTSQQGAREFLRLKGLLVRQPIDLATHHFLLTHLAAAGFAVREIARQFDPYWSLRVSAVEGAGRRGSGVIRRGINSAIQALGSGTPITDMLIDRRGRLFDVCFLHPAGKAGTVQLRKGRMRYVVGKPHL